MTYLGDDARLEITTLESRQKQVGSVASSNSSGSAGQESDSVEAHDGWKKVGNWAMIEMDVLKAVVGLSRRERKERI